MARILLSCCALLYVIGYAYAVSMTAERATFRAVGKTYHYDRAFAAKDYEMYIHTSALEFQPLPPNVLHQAGYSSPRHVIDKPCSSTSTELLSYKPPSVMHLWNLINLPPIQLPLSTFPFSIAASFKHNYHLQTIVLLQPIMSTLQLP
ncbi:predicted protein [Lichtheimia corymbifera JMRC:FSU:9682]|uniref:Uncharacterized protein n=1 Tax=Lichtheimia corymbifera JMRC:FSU:9682 TaxID=1263082 RepID=A0A068RJW5_9FUNG|nr:predicted protein [Lichtheimia corymbifera JMRC:FSU:9682]